MALCVRRVHSDLTGRPCRANRPSALLMTVAAMFGLSIRPRWVAPCRVLCVETNVLTPADIHTHRPCSCSTTDAARSAREHRGVFSPSMWLPFSVLTASPCCAPPPASHPLALSNTTIVRRSSLVPPSPGHFHFPVSFPVLFLTSGVSLEVVVALRARP